MAENSRLYTVLYINRRQTRRTTRDSRKNPEADCTRRPRSTAPFRSVPPFARTWTATHSAPLSATGTSLEQFTLDMPGPCWLRLRSAASGCIDNPRGCLLRRPCIPRPRRRLHPTSQPFIAPARRPATTPPTTSPKPSVDPTAPPASPGDAWTFATPSEATLP